MGGGVVKTKVTPAQCRKEKRILRNSWFGYGKDSVPDKKREPRKEISRNLGVKGREKARV